MIVTVTLNPSIDKLYLVEKLSEHTVMRVKEVHNTAGGKGLNVSRVARILGEEVTAVGFAGGFNGAYLSQSLQRQGICARLTPVTSETRCCINIREESTGEHTEFLEPGAPVTKEELDRFLDCYRGALRGADVVTISGSVPQGVSADFYGDLVKKAKENDIPVLVDTSGELLKQAVQSKPDLIKPNIDEIGQLLGRMVMGVDDVAKAAQQLHETGIRYVVVSMGKDGAVMACDEGIFQGISPDVPVINTVGCGDSMLAGLALSLSQRRTAAQMLQFSTAVSVANAMNVFTGYLEYSDLEYLYPQICVNQIG